VAAGIAAFEAEEPAAVLLDIDLPDGSGLDALREIKARSADAVVVMVTGNVVIENTISALRGGAYDFVGKPIHLEELRVTIRNGIEAHQLRREVKQVRRERARQFSFEQIIGDSAPVRRMLTLARKVAESEVASVLLQGESGTGKDLVAKAIHYGSRRDEAPFVAINCAAIPATLIESELFGYEKGAFTDAKARKEGLFEQAEGGTLFLDEIGEMAPVLQAKLLRVLQERTFERVGGTRTIRVDVRVVAATNRDLEEAVRSGAFRQDLYYRLNVVSFEMPPLRERREDVPLLASYFAAKYGAKFKRKVTGVSAAARECLTGYDWPGNVRELENAIERAVVLGSTASILPEDLPETVLEAEPAAGSDATPATKYHEAVREAKRQLITRALEQSSGSITEAARALGVHPNYLHRLIRNLNLRPETKK
jgi:DNA-binding NtrC family response regulator